MTDFSRNPETPGRPGPVYGSSETRLLNRLSWSAVSAGAFMTLALLAISAVLAHAIGMEYPWPLAVANNAGVGAIIWGVIAAAIAMALGTWLTVSLTGYRTKRHGLLHGLTVWAVSMSFLVFLFHSGPGPMLAGSATPLLSVPAGATINGQNTQNMQQSAIGRGDMSPNTVGVAQSGAWWMLLSIASALVAAVAVGAGVGAAGERREPETYTTTRPAP